MQNFLTQAMEAAEDTVLHPGQGYSNVEHAQYDSSQYGFAQDGNSFPIDQSLDMSVNFNDAKNHDESAGNTHMSLSAQNGHSRAMGSHHGSAATSTSLATVTQPQTPFNPSTKRKSLEETSEITLTGGDSRRKRSKVSRACDQCRKKKIRCDADSGDGTLKTCTNCIKQGQTCDYNRIPQKRGPSKGYIKDLSERVHHLEDSLASAGNYRSSLDAATYGDPPFSPEEDPALRRPTSISQQRSPFADFTRDRFPSVGGWNNNIPPSSQPRDRGSIAIPPDQIGPPQPSSAKSSKAWWAPLKLPLDKGKTPIEIEEATKMLQGLKMHHYYDIIHSQCSILPDEAAKTLVVLEKASLDYIQMFSIAMKLLPQKKNDVIVPSNPTAELANLIDTKSRLKWVERTNVDNLVLLWSTLLLHIVYLHDMLALTKQDPLVGIELDLVSGFVKMKDFMHDPQHESEWIRSFNMVAMFARLNAVSKGDSSDPLPSYLAAYLNIDWRIVLPRPRFVVVMTDVIQAALSVLPRNGVSLTAGSSEGFARLQSSTLRAWSSASGLSEEEPFVREIDAFGTLLSLRFVSPGARPAIVGPVCNLIEAIRGTSLQQSDDKYVFNPLSFHTVSLALITLLELQSCSFDHQQGQALVESATNDMVRQLAELVGRRAQLDGGAGGLFWANALVQFADERVRQNSRTLPVPEEKGEDEIVPEMARILHQGYLFPILDSLPR